jgi:hypothetical protein
MRNFYGLVAFVAIGVAACSDGTGPSAAPQFSRQITFPDLQTKLQGLPTNGAARAEIELPPTGFVAREVNVEDHEEVDDHESVRGEITALTVSGDNGTLTLAPGFQVTFTATTMFETGDDMSLTFQQFVDRVQAALGQTPAVNLGVRAGRAAMDPLALGPADAFPASKLELKPDVDHPKLKINVTQANLVTAGDGDCTMTNLGVAPVGCLKVLGVTVGIANETELKAMNPGVVKAEFEGLVDCAKPIDASSFFLKSGAQIMVDEHTQIEGEHGDEHLSLADVKTACAATPAPDIDAEGEGVLVSASGESPVIRATEVKFEREEDEAIEAEFTGMIDAIGTDNITVSGRVVMVDASTEFEREGSGESQITFADLHTGDTVEVKAIVDASGKLLAREIKVRS